MTVLFNSYFFSPVMSQNNRRECMRRLYEWKEYVPRQSSVAVCPPWLPLWKMLVS